MRHWFRRIRHRYHKWRSRKYQGTPHSPGIAPTPEPAPIPEATSPTIPSTAALTTLSEILSGKFTSASNKHGLNGTLVRIVGLTVISTKIEADGDTHIVVSDGTVNPFIAEITPVEKQVGLSDPTVGSVVTIVGYVYWDSAHVNEVWHGNTGWEIHPIKEIWSK